MLCNLLTLQCIVREGFNSDTEVVYAWNVVPCEGKTSSRCHQTRCTWCVNQECVLTTDEGVSFCKTFSSTVLHSFHDVEVLYLKDFSQLGICDECCVGNSSTAIQTCKHIWVVDEDVTNFLTDNHCVWLEATRLKLHGTTSSSHISDWCGVCVVRPQVSWSSICTPDTSSEEGRSELLFTLNKNTVNKCLCASGTNFQHCIFVSKCLLIEVHAKAIYVSKVAVVGQLQTNAVYFCAWSKFLNITRAVHVRTVIDVVFVRLTLNTYYWENLVSDKVSLFLYICQCQVRQWHVKMYIRWGQNGHYNIPLNALLLG